MCYSPVKPPAINTERGEARGTNSACQLQQNNTQRDHPIASGEYAELTERTINSITLIGSHYFKEFLSKMMIKNPLK